MELTAAKKPAPRPTPTPTPEGSPPVPAGETASELPLFMRKSAAAASPSGSAAPAPPPVGSNMWSLFAAGTLRAKLRVGSARDPVEDEADRVAARVVDGGAPCPSCASGASPCPTCGAGAAVRRKPNVEDAPEAESSLSLGVGRPLGDAERTFFEPRLGADLGDVRVHDDGQAASNAARIDARAFSLGRHIAFGEGEYQPQTSEGQRLIAHELAHVVNGHGDIRRNGGDDHPAPDPDAADFDPCAVDVGALDNRELLRLYHAGQTYINGLTQAGRQGEDRYYDYGNLMRRLDDARRERARAGHVWLNADVDDVPGTLWHLSSSPLGNLIDVTPGDTGAAGENQSVGDGLLLTQSQFDELLAREQLPTVSPADFFAQQDPDQPQQPLEIQVPDRPDASSFPSGVPPFYPTDPYGLGASPFGFPPVGGVGSGVVSPTTSFVYDPFARPVVTGVPVPFAPDQVGGFRTDWRGDIGEARFMAQDLPTLLAMQDLNQVQANFPLYDVRDPRVPASISIKTQLPDVAGGTPSFESVQTASRELFGPTDPTSKRANALALLQTLDPTMTQDRMLLSTQIAVNQENVGAVQDSLVRAIQRGQSQYEPLLSALLRQQPVSVQMKDRTTRVYSDFPSLEADFTARLMSEARYRAAVTTVAQRARSQIVSNASTESDLRSVLDYRQRYDFRGASDFAGFADTTAGRQDARALQELYFRRMAVPELLDVQAGGAAPVIGSAARTGSALGGVSTALLQLPQLAGTWNQDPYAGRRYLTHVALSTAGGGAQGAADQAMRIYLSQAALDAAATRAAAGQSISALSMLTPAARFTGSTALGGVAAGGLTLGGMYIDESFFGAHYTRSDYTARATRAFVSGSVASAAGTVGTALTTAGVAALAGAEGGGGACTLVVPGVGTVACGAVGAVGGFIVGLGAYFLFDYTFGDQVESTVRDAMGEQGCTGARPTPGQ